MWLFVMPYVGLWSVSVIFIGHTHLLFESQSMLCTLSLAILMFRIFLCSSLCNIEQFNCNGENSISGK